MAGRASITAEDRAAGTKPNGRGPSRAKGSLLYGNLLPSSGRARRRRRRSNPACWRARAATAAGHDAERGIARVPLRHVLDVAVVAGDQKGRVGRRRVEVATQERVDPLERSDGAVAPHGPRYRWRSARRA